MVAAPLAAQAPRAHPTCQGAEYRQLDFWVGDWDVTSHGHPAGKNLVTSEETGCLVHEHWTGSEGDTGQSFNFYDRGDRQWHQVWVSNSGTVLDLAGTYADGTLTYRGQSRRPDGTTLEHRLSFHANPDGTVHQLWQTSSDGGATWSEAFEGLYRKRRG
ncbi:MAG: hypothetical protein ACTHM9_10860 [Gemmatimonadales bacterium]